MSKKSWLPTQKGTDLFPNTTQIPTNLKIRDVEPGTELYDNVASEYDGQLRQFHAKAQQTYSLSTNPIMRLRASFGDEARATYTNIQGMETLELEVSRSKLEKLLEEGKIFPWDWLVVDFEAPQFLYTYRGTTQEQSTPVAYYAKFKAPHITGTPTDPSLELGAAGKRVGHLYSGEHQPLLQWAGTPTRPQTSDGQLTEADGLERDSLLIDLREFPTYEELVIEIYAGLEPMVDDTGFEITGPAGYVYLQQSSTPDDLQIGGVWTTDTITQDTGLLPPGTPNPYTNYHDTSGEPTDHPTLMFLGLNVTPPTPGSFITGLGTYYPGGVINDPEPQGQTEDAHTGSNARWIFHENTLHYKYYLTYNYTTPPVPVTPTTSVTPKFALFKGTPNWVWSDHLLMPSDLDFMRWEVATHYPTRFGTTSLVKTPIALSVAGTDTGPATNHGLTKIGEVHVSPKKGWVVFTPVKE